MTLRPSALFLGLLILASCTNGTPGATDQPGAVPGATNPSQNSLQTDGVRVLVRGEAQTLASPIVAEYLSGTPGTITIYNNPPKEMSKKAALVALTLQGRTPLKEGFTAADLSAVYVRVGVTDGTSGSGWARQETLPDTRVNLALTNTTGGRLAGKVELEAPVMNGSIDTASAQLSFEFDVPFTYHK